MEFLEAHKIQPTAPEVGATAPPAAIAEVQQRCKEIMDACLQFRNLHGPDLEELVRTIRERCGPHLVVDDVL